MIVFQVILEFCETYLSLDETTTKFGQGLKEQVEERLRFFEDGVVPTKNVDVMHKVIEELALEKAAQEEAMETEEPPKRKRKRDSDKKEKSKKKRKSE